MQHKFRVRPTGATPELIANQYDEMVKFATALRIGTAETEAILRRFTREMPQHPTLYLASFAVDLVAGRLRRRGSGGLGSGANGRRLSGLLIER